jgi:hypothetical protein
LIEILLEPGEDFADFFGAAEVGDGDGDRVVVFYAAQGGEFALVEFFHSDGDLMGEDEIEEELLFGGELGGVLDGALFAVGEADFEFLARWGRTGWGGGSGIYGTYGRDGTDGGLGFEGFAVPLGIAEVVVGFYEIVDREVILPVEELRCARRVHGHDWLV